MRDYARISPLFWSGDTGRRLRGDPEALTLAFYLMTCPSSTMSGLFYLPLPTISHETGLSLEATRRALMRLEAEEFAFYEEDAELVWVPEMARCQVGAELAPGDKRIKGLVREIERSRRSPFYSAFFARYAERYHLPPVSHPFEGPCKGLRAGSEAPSKGLRMGLSTCEQAPPKGRARGFSEAAKPLRSQDQDQEQDQEQEQEQEIVAPASLSRRRDRPPAKQQNRPHYKSRRESNLNRRHQRRCALWLKMPTSRRCAKPTRRCGRSRLRRTGASSRVDSSAATRFTSRSSSSRIRTRASGNSSANGSARVANHGEAISTRGASATSRHGSPTQ